MCQRDCFEVIYHSDNFLNEPFPASFLIYFRLFCTLDRKQLKFADDWIRNTHL